MGTEYFLYKENESSVFSLGKLYLGCVLINGMVLKSYEDTYKLLKSCMKERYCHLSNLEIKKLANRIYAF